MTVRFKFRSSLNFDAVDIDDGRTSISVRDLKSKIIRFKNLNICQDFDLVLSDPLTGQEYANENFQIPDGSSVIIKRVPAEPAQTNVPYSNAYENLWMKETANANPSVSPNIEAVDFDDFGVDLYPVPEATTLFGLNLDVHKKSSINDVSPNIGVAAKCFEPAEQECPKFETSDSCDSIPGRPAYDGVVEGFPKKLELKIEEEIKNAKAPTVQNDNVPPELKCSVCNSFFKEAVMIPCCQHSFCQKCIYQVLLEKARCPKCFSAKCQIEDLLPNVSLRQAIEHFLESQILKSGLGNDRQQYAPDGESGIQAKDVSCGMSVFQRAPDLTHSPSETGRGSNHVMVELLHKMQHIDKAGPGDLVDCDDFQGESQPMHEEAESTVKKKREVWVDNEGGPKSFVETGRRKKGNRRCYMCGSPDHFFRVCPAALSPQPMLQSGNAMFPRTVQGYMPFWDASLMPHIRPYGSLHGNCGGMIPFNTRIAPAAPFAVPTYMSSIYRPVAAPGRCMRMGGVGPPLGTSEGNYESHSEFLDVQEREKRRKLSNHNFRREPLLADDEDGDFNKMCIFGDKETWYDHNAHISKEKSRSYSDDNSSQRSQRKNYHLNHRDDDIHLADGYPQKISHGDRRRYHHSEGPSSVVDDLPCSSSCDSSQGNKNHHKSSKRNYGKKEHDFSRHRSRARNESDSSRRRIEHGIKRHTKKHYFRVNLEDSNSSEQKKQQKAASQSSKHSKHNLEKNNAVPNYNRWQMVSGSDEDGAEEYQYYKRKMGH